MTEQEYRADSRMNVSLLVHGLPGDGSMKHLRSEQLDPSPQTPAMRRGTMAHTFMLQPEEFDRRYVRMPAFEYDEANFSGSGKTAKRSTSKNTKWYQNRVAAFLEEHEGAEIIEAKDLEWCEAISKAVYSAPEAREILDACEWEVPLFGEIEGVECKGLLDLLSQTLYADIKTAVNVHPKKFGSAAARLRYTHKVAWYRELARINGYPVNDVKFIAVESDKPHDVVVSNVPDIVMDNAIDELRGVLREYKRAKAADVWPGISGGKVLELEVPLWSIPEEEDLAWSDT